MSMTKKIKNSSAQTSIFDWLQAAQIAATQNTSHKPGSCDIDSELRAAVSQDLKHAHNISGRELSRYEVAATMSELVGCEVTASMLYNWTADSHEKHNMPVKYLPAFVQSTGGRRAFEVLSHHAGLFALPGPDALRSEIRRIEEQIEKLHIEKGRRKTLLQEVEK
jgi:hypothetical protein